MSDQDDPPHTTAEALARAASLVGLLNEQLGFYRAHSAQIRPDVAQAYDRLVTRLAILANGEIGPAVGQPMPDFLLPDQQGRLVSLEALLQTGPVVIGFNRGHWCPYCKLELRALAAIEPTVRNLGALIVSIMPERAQFTKTSVAENTLPFPILSDVDLGYSLSAGLIYWVGEEIKKLYESLGVELSRYQGNGSHFLPVTAKFIVGQDGLVKARAVNVDFRERMEPAAIVAALETLRRGKR